MNAARAWQQTAVGTQPYERNTEKSIGCLAWQRDGLVVPEAIKVATDGYRAEMDSVGRWLAENCELTGNPSHRWETSYLVLNYQAWCSTEGETPVEPPVLGKELNKRNVGSEKSHGTRYRTGIRSI